MAECPTCGTKFNPKKKSSKAKKTKGYMDAMSEWGKNINKGMAKNNMGL